MAKDGDRTDWDVILGNGNEAPRRRDTRQVPRARTREERVGVARAWLIASVSALGFFLLSWLGEGTWLSTSPFFLAVECVACFFLLLLCAALGLVWYLLTGDWSVASWAWEMLPAGQESLERDVVGVVAFLGVVLACLCGLPEVLSRSERATDTGVAVMVWISSLFGLAGIVTLLARWS